MAIKSDNIGFMGKKVARTDWQTLSYSGLIDPVGIPIPIEWQKAEMAIIRLRIESRDSSVGRTDLSKIIAREWSGYWYLYRDNYQISNGAIDFKSEQIYFDRWLWNAEIATQQLAQRLPTIETTQPEENIEELSEFLILGGEILAGIVANLNLPIVGDILQFIVDFFAGLSSGDLNYLPSPYRPDTIYLWFPVGKVSVSVEFHWLGYSPLAIGAGLAEIPIEEAQQLPNLPDADSPLNPSPQKSFGELALENGYFPLEEFESYARESGYILSSNCPNFLNADLKERIDRTTADLQKIIDNLLLQGAISQADINAIRAINPSISNADLLKQLIDDGKILSSELDAAIERATLESYIPRAGKKAGWFVLAAYRRSSCVIAYDLYSVFGSPQTSIGLVTLAQNSTAIPSINWAAAQNSSALMFPVAVFESIISNSCGDISDRFRVRTGNIMSSEFFVQSRSQGIPRIFYSIQP